MIAFFLIVALTNLGVGFALASYLNAGSFPRPERDIVAPPSTDR